MNRLKTAITGGAVNRYHTVEDFTIKQTVSQHVFNLYHFVYDIMGGSMSPYLVKSIMFHDIEEQVTGDIPSAFKRENPVLKELCDEVEFWFHQQLGIDCSLSVFEQRVLKWADMLECGYHSAKKMKSNDAYKEIPSNVIKYLRTLNPPNKKANEMLKDFELQLIGVNEDASE